MVAFNFLPQGQLNKAINEVDPSLGSMTSKSICVDIPMIEVSVFFQTPIHLTSHWSTSLR